MKEGIQRNGLGGVVVVALRLARNEMVGACWEVWRAQRWEMVR